MRLNGPRSSHTVIRERFEQRWDGDCSFAVIIFSSLGICGCVHPAPPPHRPLTAAAFALHTSGYGELLEKKSTPCQIRQQEAGSIDRIDLFHVKTKPTEAQPSVGKGNPYKFGMMRFVEKLLPVSPRTPREESFKNEHLASPWLL